MALIWAESFDIYGTDISKMTNGLYAAVDSHLVLTTANPRHGTYNAHYPIFATLRRVLGGFKTIFGFGQAVYMTSLPVSTGDWVFCSVLNFDAVECVKVDCTTDGRFRVKDRNGAQIGLSGQVFLALAYQHVEIKFNIALSGSVEIRLNGVTVLNLTGVDTRGPTINPQASQIQWGNASISGLVDTDDAFCWDDTGSVCNDFIGDHRVRVAALTADQAASAWTRNTGSSDFGTLIEIPADGDTTYLESSVAGDISEFAFADVPIDVLSVTAVYVTTMSKKTDSGACNVKTSMLSGGSTGAGVDNAISTLYTYYQDAFSVDPNTNAAWTIPAVNAATIRLERTL